MVNLSRVVFSVLLCAQALSAQANVSGTWVAKSESPMGELEFVFELKTDVNGKITGTQRGPFGDSPIVDGKVTGDKVELTVETESFGSLSKSTVTGTIVGEELQIIPAMPGGGRGRGPGAGPNGPGGPPMGMGGPPPGDAGPGGPTLSAGRGGTRFMSQPLIARRGTPTPSYRAASVNYSALRKVELPAVKDLPPNGLAKTPPMGWNSWNKFHTKIDDRTVREIADAIVSTGMKDAGYRYVNIDDGWEWKRDQAGKILPNPNFPDMKALAAYVHSKGLKLGIYSSPGPTTCGGYEGSYGHEEQDSKSYADWGIDYLKYDWCSASRVWKDEDMRAAYQKMGDALRNSGREIVYSLCQYGRANVGEWGPVAGGNLWRTTGDIRDSWQSMAQIGFSQGDMARFTKPGWWPDADMLEVGNGGMTVEEYRTHLSLWAMIGAPLIAGNDIRSMTPQIKEILTNKDVIAVDQDTLGKGGRRISQQGDTEVWVRPLSNGDYAVALFNRGESEADIQVNWSEIGLGARAAVKDLWLHKSHGTVADGFQTKVGPHGVALIRITKQ